jgi:hypothetical protein
MEFENQALRANKEKLEIQLAKLKAEKGLLKKYPQVTPGH